MPGFLGLQRFFGGTVSGAAGYAAGGAIARVLHPQLQSLANEGWQLHPDVPIDAGVLANGVAQGQVPYEWAQEEATRTGLNKERFDHLVNVASTGPGVPVAFDLWRRGVLDEKGFRRAAKRQGLEQEWIDDLVRTFYLLLDPSQLAAAIHRGLIPDPGLLKGRPPGPDRKVEAYPVYQIDAEQEAQGSGYDRDRLGVLVGLQGLPMAPHEAAQAYFRGIITLDDFLASIAQSNSRNEWWEAILEQSRQIPTSRDFLENALRGHHELPWAYEQVARHGMSPEDALILWQNQGRAMNLHQITQALAWGAKYNPAPGDEQDPWHASTLLGPIRPEYYELNDALKYTLPSALYFRTLQQQKVLSPDEAFVWYKRLGWPPELARQVADAYGKAKSTATKEATVADLLTLYEGEQATRAETLVAIEALGYPADEATRKVDLIEARRIVSAKTAAISDLHGAFKKGAILGTAAQASLEALGLGPATATAILDAWRTYLAAEAASATTPPAA